MKTNLILLTVGILLVAGLAIFSLPTLFSNPANNDDVPSYPVGIVRYNCSPLSNYSIVNSTSIENQSKESCQFTEVEVGKVSFMIGETFYTPESPKDFKTVKLDEACSFLKDNDILIVSSNNGLFGCYGIEGS